MLKQIEALRIEIRTNIADYKLQKRRKLRFNHLRTDPNRRKFWRFLKHQIKSASQITAALKDDKIVFEQSEIEDTILDHFSKIFDGKRQASVLPPPERDPVQMAIDEIDQILDKEYHESTKFESLVCAPYTMLELEQTLCKLPTGKASGYDGIPNELLMNTNFEFRKYLQIFLNRILETGKVPETLNAGKCYLIYKVMLIMDNSSIIMSSQQNVSQVYILHNEQNPRNIMPNNLRSQHLLICKNTYT